MIPPNGPPDKIVEQHAELKAVDGSLRVTGDLESSLAFYRDEYVLTIDRDGQVSAATSCAGRMARSRGCATAGGCGRSRLEAHEATEQERQACNPMNWRSPGAAAKAAA